MAGFGLLFGINNGLLPGSGFRLWFDRSMSAEKVPVVVLDAGKAKGG